MKDINKILALPIKVPKLEPDNWDTFWKIWKENAVGYKRLAPDRVGNNGMEVTWNGFIWDLVDPNPKPGMWDVNFVNLDLVFPKLKEQIDQLPFKTHKILFQSNIIPVALHKDGMKLTDHLPYACAYRSMFYDSNPNPNFFFQRNRFSEKQFLKMPENTNSFVYNNPKIYHGATYEGHFKIIAHFVIGNIDEPRWFKILEDSYSEYKDIFVITEE